MLYNLLSPYIHQSHAANLFHYVTFRSGLAILLSLGLCLVFIPRCIKYFKYLQKDGQPIRDDGPETHKSKSGTPTMGGILIFASITITTLLLVDLSNKYIWVLLFVLTSLTLVGFIDDYKKVVKKHNRGMRGKIKLLMQLIISLIACIAIQLLSTNFSTHLTVPFFKHLIINLSYFYIPFVMFVIVGSSNAVNLTDGLDGLVIAPIIITAASFAFISYLVSHSVYANYLHIIHIPECSEITIFCCSIVGSSLGFLWFNAQPAEIFMGDTGSLSLGGALGSISVITKHEIVLSIIGGLFVVETISVILQVYYFKISGGKRIFKMAPLHHHFEKCGWQESKVVIRFWIASLVCALIGLSSLKLR